MVVVIIRMWGFCFVSVFGKIRSDLSICNFKVNDISHSQGEYNITFSQNTKHLPAFLLFCLCVERSPSLCLSPLAFPFDLQHSSPLGLRLFYAIQSVKSAQLLTHGAKVKQGHLFRLKQYYRTLWVWCCDCQPLSPALDWIWWGRRLLSETVCHCSPWSSLSWNAPSTGRCWRWGWSFSSPGCAPICLQVGAYWEETWHRGRGGGNRLKSGWWKNMSNSLLVNCQAK